MVGITFVEHDGTPHRVEIAPGSTLMEAARWNGVRGIHAACGGDGGCATCHVYLDRRWTAIVGATSARERSTLRFARETTGESRLACYIIVSDEMEGLVARMPERQF